MQEHEDITLLNIVLPHYISALFTLPFCVVLDGEFIILYVTHHREPEHGIL